MVSIFFLLTYLGMCQYILDIFYLFSYFSLINSDAFVYSNVDVSKIVHKLKINDESKFRAV